MVMALTGFLASAIVPAHFIAVNTSYARNLANSCKDVHGPLDDDMKIFR
jgi:hypothetical protein